MGPLIGAAHITGFAQLKQIHAIVEGGIGHNLPQEAPQAFAEAIIDVDGFQREG
jgi:hypothetical protein